MKIDQTAVVNAKAAGTTPDAVPLRNRDAPAVMTLVHACRFPDRHDAGDSRHLATGRTALPAGCARQRTFSRPYPTAA